MLSTWACLISAELKEIGDREKYIFLKNNCCGRNIAKQVIKNKTNLKKCVTFFLLKALIGYPHYNVKKICLENA
jgi:hypothetical protein